MLDLIVLWLISCAILFCLWRGARQGELIADKRLRETQSELQKAQAQLRPLARKVMASKNEVVWRDKKLSEIEETLKQYFPEAFLKDADRKDADWGWRLNRIQRVIRHQQYGLDATPSEPKSNRQIGLEYEMSVAHEYRLHGYKVDLRGSRLGYDDMGIDLIAQRDGRTVLIQCKYWGYGKLVRENAVCQLKGSWDFYLLKNHLPRENVQARIITSVYLSKTAREVADAFGIVYEEGHEKVIFPPVKCVWWLDTNQEKHKVYYLPDDWGYEMIQPNEERGEHWAYSEEVARYHGFQHITNFQPRPHHTEHSPPLAYPYNDGYSEDNLPF